MNNILKVVVLFLLIIFAIPSIFQLSFTFVNNKIENEAIEYSINKIQSDVVDYDKLRNFERINYLDSLSNISVFNNYTYDDIKNRALPLGLDLKGGINVILQISVKDILKTLSNNSKNPEFNQALKDA